MKAIEIFRHTFDEEDWFTDSSDWTDSSARRFAPYGNEDGAWYEVRDGRYLFDHEYEYWPSDGLLVER